MSYTLKLKKRNTPLFISDDNLTLTSEPTRNFLQFDSLNELAHNLINGTYVIPEELSSRWVVSKSDIASLNCDKQIKNLTSNQDLEAKTKLINVDAIKYVAQRRAAKIYLENVKLDLLSDEVKNLYIIQIPKSDSHNFQVDNTLIKCSDYSAQIFYKHSKFKVIDTVDLSELFENHNVNIEKFDYLAVVES